MCALLVRAHEHMRILCEYACLARVRHNVARCVRGEGARVASVVRVPPVDPGPLLRKRLFAEERGVLACYPGFLSRLQVCTEGVVIIRIHAPTRLMFFGTGTVRVNASA